MKKIIPLVIVAVIFAGGGFFGGMKYTQSKNSNTHPLEANGLRAAGLGSGNFRGRNSQNGNGFTSGKVISKDTNSITIELSNSGGSKIIFLSASTTIMKATNGSITDIESGKQIVVNGTQNSDGSLTAQNIQIR